MNRLKLENENDFLFSDDFEKQDTKHDDEHSTMVSNRWSLLMLELNDESKDETMMMRTMEQNKTNQDRVIEKIVIDLSREDDWLKVAHWYETLDWPLLM